MTPLPKKKSTKSRTGQRREANRLSLANFSICTACKKLKLPHVVCPHCGYHHARKSA